MGKTSISPSFSTETTFWDTRSKILFHRGGVAARILFSVLAGGGRRWFLWFKNSRVCAKIASHRDHGGHLYPANVSSRLSGGWEGLGRENQDFWRLGRSAYGKSGYLEVGEIWVGTITISGGLGDPGMENNDFWRLGRSGYGKSGFLGVGEIQVGKIMISTRGWGDLGGKNQDF